MCWIRAQDKGERERAPSFNYLIMVLPNSVLWGQDIHFAQAASSNRLTRYAVIVGNLGVMADLLGIGKKKKKKFKVVVTDIKCQFNHQI